MDAYEPHRTRRGQIPVGTPSAINIYSDSTDASTLQMGVTSCRGPGLSSHPKVVQLGVMTLAGCFTFGEITGRCYRPATGGCLVALCTFVCLFGLIVRNDEGWRHT